MSSKPAVETVLQVKMKDEVHNQINNGAQIRE